MKPGCKNVLMVCLLSASCAPAMTNKISGRFYAEGSDYLYELLLKRDSTFSLRERHIEGTGQCEGTWTLLNHDSLLLRCYDEGILSQIERGYLPKRERIIMLMKGHKVKIDNILLKGRR